MQMVMMTVGGPRPKKNARRSVSSYDIFGSMIMSVFWGVRTGAVQKRQFPIGKPAIYLVSICLGLLTLYSSLHGQLPQAVEGRVAGLYGGFLLLSEGADLSVGGRTEAVCC